MTRREYTAGLPTTLASAFNVGAPTFTVTAATNWPTSNDYDFFVTIDGGTPQEERVLCSERSGTVITVATVPSSGRGKDNTGEKNHAAGATVWPSWSAQDADEANAHINAASGVHSITGSVVGTTDSQVLTNKTISSANNTMTVAQSAVTNLVSDLAAKAPLAAPTFTGTVVLPSTTSIGNVSATEIGYIDGVTSAVQTQLDAKLPLSGGTLTGNLVSSGVGTFTTNNAAGRGVCITQPSGNATNAILQFTNNAASAQLANITASPAGTVTVNPANSSMVVNAAITATGDISTSTDVLSRAVWTDGINLDGDLNAYNGGDIYTDTGYLYNNIAAIDNSGCRPINDNVGSVGSSTRRWVRVYAVNTTISSSDQRDKLDIADSHLGLDFINDLRPVSYRWKVGEKTPVLDEDGKPVLDENEEVTFTTREGVRKHYGFISQEVKQALDNSGVDDFAGWVQDDMSDPNSHQSLSYEQFIAPLIKAVQELSAEVVALKAQLNQS
jgi:hypothetical protein